MKTKPSLLGLLAIVVILYALASDQLEELYYSGQYGFLVILILLPFLIVIPIYMFGWPTDSVETKPLKENYPFWKKLLWFLLGLMMGSGS